MVNRMKHSAPAVRLLLERGADVNEVAAKQYGVDSPLILAAASGDHTSLQVLPEYGADFNAISVKTVLMTVMARIDGPEGMPITQALIYMGADIDMVNKDGNTALIFAAAPSFPSLEAFRLLVENGADTSIRNTKKFTVLMIAVQYQKISIIEILLECKSDSYINEVEEIGDSLNLAAQSYDSAFTKRQEKTMKLLLEFSRNIDREDGLFDAALSKALSTAKVEEVERGDKVTSRIWCH